MTVEAEEGTCEDCGGAVFRVGEGRFSLMPRFCQPCVASHLEEAAEAREAEERRQHLWDVARWRGLSGIPKHLGEFRFESIVGDGLDEAVLMAREWASGDRLGLVLSGPVGVGKTRIAVAAANEMIQSRAVRFVSAPLAIARLGSGSLSSRAREDTIADLTGETALVLDDLDKARPTEYAAEALFLAIDQRADGAAPLLVTTNLSSDELVERWPGVYGEAIVSRLQLLDAVRVEGEDRRGG